MSLADFVLRRALESEGLPKVVWSWVRWRIARSFHDPACTVQVHGRALRMPLSHELPTYIQLFPLYDTVLRRLGSFLRDRYGLLRMVDVGANIGDSIAASYGGEEDAFLAVEPNPDFTKYLSQNWSAGNVKIVEDVCSDRTGREGFVIDERYGTASLRRDARGGELPTITLDDLLAAYPQFLRPSLFKVDTDGNDFAVLAGARKTLADQPAVLFESDVFQNPRYVQDCLETLDMFRASGYESFLVYEKFGHPLGRHELGDLAHFKELLLFQLAKRSTYFDVLMMKEPDLLVFYDLERAFFFSTISDPALRQHASAALGAPQSHLED